MLTFLQSGPEKNAQSLMRTIIILQPFPVVAVESRGFHENAQERSLSTSRVVKYS